MTLMNWISLGVAAVLVVAYIILKVYAKRKFDQYDGLGGIITRPKTGVRPPKSERSTSANDKQSQDRP